MSFDMGRTTRALRRSATSVGNTSVEFAELLDPIVATPPIVRVDAPVVAAITLAPPERRSDDEIDDETDLEAGVEVDVHEAVTVAIDEAPPISRFANAGVDDDRLPLPAPAKRRRRGRTPVV